MINKWASLVKAKDAKPEGYDYSGNEWGGMAMFLLACASISVSGGTDVKFNYDADLLYQGGNGTPVINLEIID